MSNSSALLLLSGGLDSLTTLALAQSKHTSVHALSFNYGQRHLSELNAAKYYAEHYGVEHHIMDLKDYQLKGSALTDKNTKVPDYNGSDEIPVTYVPARNIVFLSMAAGLAESLDIRDIYIGVSSVDYSGYPDCRPEFIAAFNEMINIGTKAGQSDRPFKIHTPIIDLSKGETIALGLSLGVDYRHSVSCYQADDQGRACGQCDSCALRKQGFLAIGAKDMTSYVA